MNHLGTALIVAAASFATHAQTKVVAPPSSAQAGVLFAEAWKKHRPDFEVQSVQVLKSEPKQHQDRRWVTMTTSL